MTFPENEGKGGFGASTKRQVLIVGGGISGLTLARRMVATGWGVEVVEQRACLGEMTPKWYLVCRKTAESLGIGKEWDRRKKEGAIGGFTTYSYLSEQGQWRVIDHVAPTWVGPKDGFVVFDQRELCGHLLTEVERGGGEVNFGKEEVFSGQSMDPRLAGRGLVIRATGISSQGQESFYDKNARGRAVYGCNLKGKFDRTRLLFLFDESDGKTTSRRPPAWLMPRSESQAQLVISEDVPLRNIMKWLSDPKMEEKLTEALWTLNGTDGCVIDSRGDPFKSHFRTSGGTLTEARQWAETGQFPFGEVIGMNTPAVGELIDRIDEVAGKWTLLLDLMPNGDWPDYLGDWLYYTWRERSSPLMVAAATSTKRKWSEKGLVDPIGTALMASVPKGELWRMVRGNFRLTQEAVRAVLLSPRCYGFIASAVIAWIPMLLQDTFDRLSFERKLWLASKSKGIDR